MNENTGKQVWVAPKLERIAMVDTAAKGSLGNENQATDMAMSPTGMQS